MSSFNTLWNPLASDKDGVGRDGVEDDDEDKDCCTDNEHWVFRAEFSLLNELEDCFAAKKEGVHAVMPAIVFQYDPRCAKIIN